MLPTHQERFNDISVRWVGFRQMTVCNFASSPPHLLLVLLLQQNGDSHIISVLYGALLSIKWMGHCSERYSANTKAYQFFFLCFFLC